MEESPCESKHGEGGPRRWPEHPLAAPAPAGRRVGSDRELGGVRVQMKPSDQLPEFMDHDLGRRLRRTGGDSGPSGTSAPSEQKFRPRPAPAPQDEVGLA